MVVSGRSPADAGRRPSKCSPGVSDAPTKRLVRKRGRAKNMKALPSFERVHVIPEHEPRTETDTHTHTHGRGREHGKRSAQMLGDRDASSSARRPGSALTHGLQSLLPNDHWERRQRPLTESHCGRCERRPLGRLASLGTFSAVWRRTSRSLMTSR